MSPSLPPRAPGRFTKYLRHKRVRLLWARIIATPCITLFFILSLIVSFVLIVLQGIAYRDNSMAVTLTSAMLSAAGIEGFPIVTGGSLEVCTVTNGVLPVCSKVPAAEDPQAAASTQIFGGLNLTELNDLFLQNEHLIPKHISKRSVAVSPAFEGSQLTGVRVGEDTVLSLQCVRSMVWLNDTLKDAKREDMVTLAFHAWLFFVSMWTVVNESIPHLVAALAAHILGTAWAGARIQTAKSWFSMYRRHIVFGSCGGTDVLGDWWDLRARHATPIVFINAMSTFAFAYLTIEIFKTYSKRSVARVSVPSTVRHIYKLVSLFFASLHLAAFFNIASAAIWLNKITTGHLRSITDHIEVYLAFVIVSLVLELPWLTTGWISIRKECRVLFCIFIGIGIVPFVLATALFTSQIYGFIFGTWPFFATITITSYIFTVTTLVTGIVCRTQFGKGLAQFLEVERALERLGFAPCTLPSDLEKGPRSEIVSFTGIPAFPESPTTTKHIRAVPSLSMISNDKDADDLSRVSSIFTVTVSRRQSSQTVLDLRELPAAQIRPTSRRFSRLNSRHESATSSILELPEKPPVLALISPVSSFRVKPPTRIPSNLSTVTNADTSRMLTANRSLSPSGSPRRPPGLGLPSRPSEAVRPALSRRSTPVRSPPSSDSPSIPLPPLPTAQQD